MGGTRRSRPLADLIERLDAHVVARRPAPAIVGRSKQKAWLIAFERARVGSQSALMDSVPDGSPRNCWAKLERLRQLPADPRVASRVLWLRDVPIAGKAGRDICKLCARMLIEIDDDRFDEAIANALASDHTTGSFTVARLRHVGGRTGFKAGARRMSPGQRVTARR